MGQHRAGAEARTHVHLGTHAHAGQEVVARHLGLLAAAKRDGAAVVQEKQALHHRSTRATSGLLLGRAPHAQFG